MKMIRFAAISTLISLVFPFAVYGQDAKAPPTLEGFEQSEESRNQQYARQLEAYLRQSLVEDYDERAKKTWTRDYSSIDAFLASVEPNRKRWRAILNPPDLKVTGLLQRRPHPPLADLQGQWLTLPLGPIQAEALLVIPIDATRRCSAAISTVCQKMNSRSN